MGGGHLVGVFFLLTLMMGVVFTLGYLLGRSQYDPQLRAAVVNIAGDPAAALHPKPAPDKPLAKPLAKPPSKTMVSPRRADADRPAPPRPADGSPSPANWDFYHSVDPATGPEKLSPRAQTSSGTNPPPPAANPPAPPAKSKAPSPAQSLNAPLIPRGSIVLQVAALAHESDALAVAQTLREKKFPAFVLSPDADKLYRVQVGPYKDAKSADAARQKLEAAGFKSITKK